jgi:hypothetical protein
MPVIVTSADSSRWNAAPTAVFATIAVWLSSGTIGFRTRPAGASGTADCHCPARPRLRRRDCCLRRRPAQRAGGDRGSAARLVVLPWLPIPLPPACLIWTGALSAPIWIGVGWRSLS